MESYYLALIKELSSKIENLKKYDDYYSLGRLVSFIVFLICFYKLLENGSLLWILATLLTLSTFIILLLRNFKLQEQKKELITRYNIYNNEIDLLNYKSNSYYEGHDFVDPEHSYTSDMDIFGNHSIFGYINRCATSIGNKALAQLFLQEHDVTSIRQRQKAIKELARNDDWCIALRTILYDKKIKNFKKEYLPEIKPMSYSLQKPELWLYAYYAILVFSLSGVLFMGFKPALLLLPLFLMVIILRFTGKYIKIIKIQLEGREKTLKEYEKFLTKFETQDWDSEHLNKLQTTLKSDNLSAANVIGKLGKLSQKLDYTLNFFMAILLNYLFLWDLLMSIKITSWFKTYAAKTRKWFDIIGEVEALVSLANVEFNHKDWCYPEFKDEGFIFQGSELGHPLIPVQQRICNDFLCMDQKNISIITGSNMAGKSTFLRTLGTNIILAQMGAPVCAKKLILSRFRIMSYLNITDSLSESTSTFYREIKRLKKILDSARQDNNVLLLLDELLRGTNSADKARGSMAITRVLIEQKIPAIIATHNLELAEMQQQYPEQVVNYYFDIIIEDNEKMRFDYKIKKGICQTFNASLLLKKIGIDIGGA